MIRSGRVRVWKMYVLALVLFLYVSTLIDMETGFSLPLYDNREQISSPVVPRVGGGGGGRERRTTRNRLSDFPDTHSRSLGPIQQSREQKLPSGVP